MDVGVADRVRKRDHAIAVHWHEGNRRLGRECIRPEGKRDCAARNRAVHREKTVSRFARDKGQPRIDGRCRRLDGAAAHGVVYSARVA